MTRLLYNVALFLALPWVWGRLFVRARREPAYRERIAERFGRVPPQVSSGVIWFHTVSAGETNAAAPLIRAIAEYFPADTILVTTMTPTGSARVGILLGESVEHCYAPYDYPWAVRRFLDRTRPKALVIMETELWPNLIAETSARGAPVLLVNARLSARSYRGYRRVGGFTRRMLERIDGILCQYEDTAERFRSLGAASVEVTGSVKFDAEMPPDAFGVGDLGFGDSPVWIAGSTHAGEEAVVLDAQLELRQRLPKLRLILVPRHPARTPEVLRLAADRGLSVGLLSERARGVDVLVGDVMGTLPHLYPLARIAFVGGSLDRTGGHNPIEAAVHGLPVLMGPARFDVEEICARFAAAGCLHPVTGVDDMVEVVGGLLNDPARCAREGERAKAVVESNRGARQAVVDKLRARLARIFHQGPR
ncbi:MAG: 3-deoxy-D-manno-octulosonic acid transferase [Gammaproteobacteria bacterium]|nr:3-deoxy-D-manno-octulosonic acid transferase [Gammaproteobacteria bacterium]